MRPLFDRKAIRIAILCIAHHIRDRGKHRAINNAKVMTVQRARNSDGQSHTGRRPVLVDLVIAVLITISLVVTLTWVGVLVSIVEDGLLHGLPVKQTVDPRECATIVNESDRLACFDKYARGLMTPPVRGSFAPPQAFGQRTR
jgi:hypothetical protein